MKIRSFLKYFLLISLAGLPLFLSNWFFFLKDPPVWPDEPIFLSMAENLTQSGQAINYLYGLTEIEFQGLGYPPLYFHLLGNWVKIFGNSIESIRFLSFVLAIFTLIIFFSISKLLFTKNKNNLFAVLATLFLAANVHFSRASHLGRMEMLLLFLILLSWLLFLLAQKKQSFYLYLAAAISASLSPAAHPIGIISPIVIASSIFFLSQSLKEKIKKLFIITIPVLFINLFWLIQTQPNLLSLVSSFGSHLQGKSSKSPFMLVLFQSDFSWWLLLILYFAVILFFIPLALKLKDKLSQLILISLLVSLFITTIGKEGGYFLYSQPFFILALIFLLKSLKKFKIMPIILAVLIFFSYLNIQYLNNDNIGITNKESRSVWTAQNFDYHDFSKRLLNYFPKEEKISVFIASTPDPYFDLKVTGRFRILEAADPDFPIPDQSYKQALDSVDYLILNWVPHQYLADYINKNAEEKVIINQPKGYSALVIKLKPRKERK